MDVKQLLGHLVLKAKGPTVRGKIGPKLIEHYSYQLRQYVGFSRPKACCCSVASNLNSWVCSNGFRCPNEGSAHQHYHTKTILVSVGGKTKGKLLRIVDRYWKLRASKLRHYARQNDSQHKIVGHDILLFTNLKQVPDTLFWRPIGLRLLQQLRSYVRRYHLGTHYAEIGTPVLLRKVFWLRSGHIKHYRKNMLSVNGFLGHVVKPMNCMGHICLFKRCLRSFKDLPLRFAEFGLCHRKESSGAISGLLRTKGFTQDDAHIFCCRTQAATEVETLHRLAINTYTTFGFDFAYVKLTYPRCFGTCWSLSVLKRVLFHHKAAFEEVSGAGAFYGAKIEYHLKDYNEHLWQCGTLQLDEVLPRTMGLSFVGQDGKRSRPVILHRALLGSLERFVGVLLEHHRKLPFWVSPVKAMLLPLANTNGFGALATQVLSKAKVQHSSDLAGSSLGHKLNKHLVRRVPYLVLVGTKEQSMMIFAVRTHAELQHKVFTLESFAQLVRLKIHRFETESDI